MSCACGKRRNGVTDAAMEREANQLLLPSQWGPIMWRLLHISVEKIGRSGNKITDMDQSNFMKTIKYSINSSNLYNYSEHYSRLNNCKARIIELKIGYKYFLKVPSLEITNRVCWLFRSEVTM
jgi:hypothetical protein